MKYYVKPKKTKIKPWILVIIALLIIFNIFLYFLDKRIIPYVLAKSEEIVKADTIDTITSTSMDIFNDDFNYDEMIVIDKDGEGNITLVRANAMKLNQLTSQISGECNEKLREMGEVGVDVPIGWVTDSSMFYNLGPKVRVTVEPVGNINISYESKFESAGINQTRHKIYLDVEATIKINLPLNSKDIAVDCQIPVAETIIVGKIPSTAIDFGTQNSD